MSTTQRQSKVVPARLAFLAIYNPALGPTDETFRDQLVFYYSRAVHDARTGSRQKARNEGAGENALRQEENEKLRQIGLAQGMVDFAKSFSDGEAVDSIETEKSRIVLHELETGWWILASVDLTRLPALSASETTSKSKEKGDDKPEIEYSSREVSPPALLLQQLLQAYSIFCLHHGPSLNDLYSRLARDKFCNTLERFWIRFAESWDVLLHGNPAVDIFNGVKLAGGGELGYGVGEEEWGSGERSVLEDLTHRTDGLVDIVISRFSEPESAEESKVATQTETLPWMGGGNQPEALDGVIFGGIGALERRSLRDISLWIRQIYTYGEYAHGVRDNPLRERRKRRRKQIPESVKPANDTGNQACSTSDTAEGSERNRAAENKAVQDALEDNTASLEATHTSQVEEDRPHIPPPIVSAAEGALHKATQQVEEDETVAEDSGTTLGIPDQYMKYLTFGLSTLGKGAPKRRPTASRQDSVANSNAPPQTRHTAVNPTDNTVLSGDDEDGSFLTHLEPMPEGDSLKAKIATLKQQESKGFFLVGLKGDLDAPPEEESSAMSHGGLSSDATGSRIVLRTVQVELGPGRDSGRPNGPSRNPSEADFEYADAASKNFCRLRVLVYVHRPFIYCFLFENRHSSLQYTKFYRDLHQTLVPVHKALLSSTDTGKVAERVESARATKSGSESASISSANKSPSKSSKSSPIFDLVYDPRLLTLHTSIPNIPEPGTSAAEGILTSLISDTTTRPEWTRIEALNVHSQILNTLASVKGRNNEVERLSKTSRGWWVVWMKLTPSTISDTGQANSQASTSAAASDGPASEAKESSIPTYVEAHQSDMHRVAFLVRKASDASTAATSSSGSRAMSSMFGNMSLGLSSKEDETTGGAGAGWGPGSLAGGIGVDARKYVEGLLSLNR